jgi:hypothetical protein
MSTWLRIPRLLSGRSTSKRRHGYQPMLQSLEERCLLSSSPQIVPNLSPTPQLVASTVPPKGDLNPYGVAFVPGNFAKGGPLKPGDIIVSNFNDSSNVQGTGTTIVEIHPSGALSVFFKGRPSLGLTTALGILSRGFVLVGNLPTDANGNPEQGSLLIIDRTGHLVETLSDPNLLDGPWDLAVNDQGATAQVFVSNVLSGTVTRINLNVPNDGSAPAVTSETQIASGYFIRPDPAALVVGPTGLAYNASQDLLYVASTGDNEIFSIANAGSTNSDAGKGNLVYQDDVHLHGPLGLLQAPNGDLVSTQGDAVNPDPNQPSEIVEFTPSGSFVAQVPVDSSGQQGGAFGIALASSSSQITFAAVDDIFNTLEVWTIQTGSTPASLGSHSRASAELAVLSTLAGIRESHATATTHSLVSSSHESGRIEGNFARTGQGSESNLSAATIRASMKRAARTDQFKAIETLFADWER